MMGWATRIISCVTLEKTIMNCYVIACKIWLNLNLLCYFVFDKDSVRIESSGHSKTQAEIWKTH